ncbi:MAG: glycosyltransferase [Harvfovirus sp.]|uniref:Glycosyltransferase n=1 Tax=Harvfovirus sp. TaxID=2487768 RepID=A0A3G5A6I1_9VIRU|nr:MAG: glycosyltransferase [Harvfovirus sp.]
MDKEFDWEFYLDYYKDLRKNGIKNKVDAYKHWLAYGRREKRARNKSETLNRIFVISHNIGGGLSQYVQDLIRLQLNDRFCDEYMIHTNENVSCSGIKVMNHANIIKKLYEIENVDNKKVILHINTLMCVLKTSVEIKRFLLLLEKKKFIRLIISVHDYYWINVKDPLNLSIDGRDNSSSLFQKMFERAALVIFPTNCVVDVYKKKINLTNVKYVVHPHQDIMFDVVPYFPKVNDAWIKILYLGGRHMSKGHDVVKALLDKLDTAVSYNFELYVGGCDESHTLNFKNIKVVNIGIYENKNIFKIINKIRPHVIIHASVFEETWSYLLSIFLRTALPIFYNDIGALKERISKLGRNNVSEFDSRIDSIDVIKEKFLVFLEKIISNGSVDYIDVDESYNVIRDPFYDELYLKNLSPLV